MNLYIFYNFLVIKKRKRNKKVQENDMNYSKKNLYLIPSAIKSGNVVIHYQLLQT